MSEIEGIYKKISKITLDNFYRYKLYLEDELFLDSPETINFDIQDYPLGNLLSIQDPEIFIRECYFKIFDRPISNSSFLNLLHKVKTGKISRINLIRRLYNSYERKIRNTGIDFSNLENS